jgi:hypothetical protein
MKFQSSESCWEITVFHSNVPGHSPNYFVCDEIQTGNSFCREIFLGLNLIEKNHMINVCESIAFYFQ